MVCAPIRRACTCCLGVALIPLAVQAEGLLAVDNPARNGAATGAYAGVEIYQANDGLSIRQDGKSWLSGHARSSGKSLAVLSARAEAGVQWDGFRVGALYRAEAMVRTNRDAADLVRQYSEGSGYDPGRVYHLDYRISGFEADGLRVSKTLQTRLGADWQLDWGMAASWLHGRRVKLETAGGQATAVSTQAYSARPYDADVSLDSMDSRVDTSGGGRFNPPFGEQPGISGQGAALDLGLILRRADGLRLELAVNDLAGRMVWKNLPEYAANYNTATRFYDSRGYVNFRPLIASQSCYRDLVQTLEPKLRLAAGYPAGTVAGGALDFLVAVTHAHGSWFPEVGIAFHQASQWGVSVSYDLRFRTTMIALRYRDLHIGVNSSRIPSSSSSATQSGAGDTLAGATPFSPVAGASARCGLAPAGPAGP